MGRIRVLVADDHPDMLSAQVSVLENDPRFEVVGTARTAGEATRIAGTGGVDLVLLDVHMPGGGPTAAEALTRLESRPVVVAISADSGSATAHRMLSAGARGYLTKGRLGENLPDLLIRAMDGEVVLVTSPAAKAPSTAAHQAGGADVTQAP